MRKTEATKLLTSKRPMTPMQEEFCQFFVDEAHGDPDKAAALAHFAVPDDGGEILKLPHVQARIRELLGHKFKIAANPSKLALIDRLWGIVMNEANAFAVAKNADTLAKVMGWFAPTHRINENIAGERMSFQSLLQTLKENGDGFSAEQKKAMLQELVVEQGALQEAIQMLSGPIDGATH